MKMIFKNLTYLRENYIDFINFIDTYSTIILNLSFSILFTHAAECTNQFGHSFCPSVFFHLSNSDVWGGWSPRARGRIHPGQSVKGLTQRDKQPFVLMWANPGHLLAVMQQC